ncbi:MAG: ABC transporter ATP-binding protein [Clostridia bacterium]|nr:ABC transporter ATP-binding protein [Clostridia bacterium]
MIKLFKYLKPHKRFAIFTVILAAISNVMTLGFPLMMSMLINNGISEGNLDYIKNIGIVMIILCTIAMFISIANSYCSSKVSALFTGDLRRMVFSKIQTFSQGDIDEIGIPSLITRTTNDIRQIGELLIALLRSIISVPIMLIGGTAMAIIMDPGLSKVLLIVCPVIVVLAIVIAKTVVPFFKKIQKGVDTLNLVTREKLNGVRVIRAFNRTEYEERRFKKANDNLTSLNLKVSRIFAGLIPVATLLIFMIIATLIVVGYKQVNELTDPQEIANTIGDLQGFIIYLVFIVAALASVAAMFVMIPRGKISANRINEILDHELKMTVREKTTNEENEGTIEFKNVVFDYKDEDGNLKRALNNVSFVAEKGKTTAIIGSTGSGKSTVLNLIPRFYDVTDGAVLIDGVDVREMDFASIYEKLGYIPQQAFLFSGTVADNLRYGNEDATDEELWEALEIAQSRDFVENLPQKLESMVSQNGTNLSGGQRQRLCIARAIVKKAKFYMFDDSFSALDFITDSKLRAQLKTVLTGSAIIIVAQRVGTIIDADNIIVLENGKIVGQGTHKELLENCGVYKEMADSQLEKTGVSGE